MNSNAFERIELNPARGVRLLRALQPKGLHPAVLLLPGGRYRECNTHLVLPAARRFLDAGWHCYSGYNIEDMVFWMDYGPFTYSVYFNEKITDYNMDTFDAEEGIKDLTVKNIEFFMLGDGATNLDEE